MTDIIDGLITARRQGCAGVERLNKIVTDLLRR
jgi:hypothetical protein